MATLTIGPKTEFTPLTPDYYKITLERYTVRERPADKYHKDAYQDIEFDWLVAVPDDEPVNRKSWVNIPHGWNEKSGLCKLLIAMGMVDPADGVEGFEIDLDALLGQSCRANIVEVTKADGTITDKIADYSPLAVTRRAGKPTQAAPRAQSRTAPKPAADEVYDASGDVVPF